MRRLRLGLKYTGLVAGALTIALAGGAFLFLKSNIPQDTIKKIVEYELGKTFKQPVTIERLEGNLLSNAIIKDMRIPNHQKFPKGTIVHIGELTAEYSIWRAIFRHGGDIAAAADKIHVKDMTLNILRTDEDEWNVFYLFPPLPPGMPPQPTTFRGIMTVENFNIEFQDEHGWGETLIAVPFRRSFSSFSGQMDYADVHHVKLFLTGKLEDGADPIAFKGWFSGYDGRYDLDITASKLPLQIWGPYAFPFEGYKFSQGNVVFQGRIRTKWPIPKNDIPFFYRCNLKISDATFKLPFFEDFVLDSESHLTMLHGQFIPQDIRGIAKQYGHATSDLWQALQRAGIIDRDGWLIENIDAYPQTHEWVLGTKYVDVSQVVVNSFRKPAVTFLLNHFDGTLNTIALKGDGVFGLSEDKIALNLRTSSFDLPLIKSLFPGLENWRFSGVGRSTIAVKGALSSPIVQGILHSASPTFYAFNPKDVQIAYKYRDGLLDLSLRKGRLYDGRLRGSGRLNLKGKTPRFNLRFSANDIRAKRVFPEIAYATTGNVRLQSHIRGQVNRYSIKSHLTSDTLSVFNQYVPRFKTTMIVEQNRHIRLRDGQLFLNQTHTPIAVTGNILNLVEGTFVFKGEGVDVADFDLKQVNPVTGSVQLQGVLHANMDKNFWKRPYQEVSATFNTTFSDYTCFGNTFEKMTFNFRFDRSRLDIVNLQGENGEERIGLTGFFTGKRPRQLDLLARNVDFERSTLIQTYIPERLKPFGGIANIDLRIVPKGDDMTLKGKMLVRNGIVENQKIASTAFSFDWDGETFSAKDVVVKQGTSELYVDGAYSENTGLDIKVKRGTKVELSDFQTLLAPLGTMFGYLDIQGSVSGHFPVPNFNFDFSAQGVRSNFLSFDFVNGGLSMNTGKLRARKLSLRRGTDRYQFDGFFDLTPVINKQAVPFSELQYDVKFNIDEADLTSFSEIVEGLNKEIRSRRRIDARVRPEKIVNPNVRITSNARTGYAIVDRAFGQRVVSLYRQGSSSDSVSLYDRIQSEDRLLRNPAEIGLKKIFKGKLSGFLHLTSKFRQNPRIRADIWMTDAEISLLQSEKIHIFATPKKYENTFGLTVGKGILGAKTFDQLLLAGSVTDSGQLNIKRSNVMLDGQRHKDVLRGTLPLSSIRDKTVAEEPMNLDINLNGNTLALLSIFNPLIKDIRNDGHVLVNMGGTLDNPVLNSRKISLKNAAILFSDSTIFRSPFRITDDTIRIDNNRIIVPGVSVLWQGEDTDSGTSGGPVENTLYLTGGIDLKNLSLTQFDKIEILMDLSVANTDIGVNLPKIYRGDISLQGITIRGGYDVPLSKAQKLAFFRRQGTDEERGPVLSGMLSLRSGEIALPTLEKKPPKPSFLLNIETHIGQDMGIHGSLFGEGFVAGLGNTFSLELGKTETPLIIKGSLNALRVQNTISFTSGVIHFLNRSFDVLETEKQKHYFPEDQLLIRPNTLAFGSIRNPETNKRKLQPNLNIAALTVIEPFTSTAATANVGSVDNAQSKDNQHVLVLIQGPATDLSSMTFRHFRSSKLVATDDQDLNFVNQYQLSERSTEGDIGTGSDSQEVVRLLMPDLFLLENNDAGNLSGADRTQRIIGGSVANQLNAAIRRNLLRPLEKQIASSVGLEDIRVEYNVGTDILNRVSDVTQLNAFGPNQNNLGLNLTKNLISDRLFLRVRTDLDVSGQSTTDKDSTFQLSEVELTYLILRNLSLNYANIRKDETSTSLKPKFSLRFRHEF